MLEDTQAIRARDATNVNLYDLPRPRGQQIMDKLRLEGVIFGRTVILAKNYLWIEGEGAVPYTAVIRYNRVDGKRIGVKISWVSKNEEIRLIQGFLYRLFNVGAKKTIDKFVHRLHERVLYHKRHGEVVKAAGETPCPNCDCQLPLENLPEGASQVWCPSCFTVLPVPIGPGAEKWRHLGFCESCRFYEPIQEFTHYFTWGAVLASITHERVRYLCEKCARMDWIFPFLGTFALGWWAFPKGPFATTASLVRNIKAGFQSFSESELEEDEFSTDLRDFVETCKKLNVEEAEEEFNRLRKSYPNHFSLYYNLGRVYLLRGQKDKAQKMQEVARKFLPNLPEKY